MKNVVFVLPESWKQAGTVTAAVDKVVTEATQLGRKSCGVVLTGCSVASRKPKPGACSGAAHVNSVYTAVGVYYAGMCMYTQMHACLHACVRACMHSCVHTYTYMHTTYML